MLDATSLRGTELSLGVRGRHRWNSVRPRPYAFAQTSRRVRRAGRPVKDRQQADQPTDAPTEPAASRSHASRAQARWLAFDASAASFPGEDE